MQIRVRGHISQIEFKSSYFPHIVLALLHACNLFTNFSHVFTIKFCESEDYIHFLASRCKFYVNYYIECTKDGKVHYFLLYKDQSMCGLVNNTQVFI